ncbi:3217_t:CDS:1, partial [Paraglomus occultum]
LVDCQLMLSLEVVLKSPQSLSDKFCVGSYQVLIALPLDADKVLYRVKNCNR